MFYRAGLRTGVKDKHIYLILAGTYSIYAFNTITNVKVAMLQKRQNWRVRQIEDVKLVI